MAGVSQWEKCERLCTAVGRDRLSRSGEGLTAVYGLPRGLQHQVCGAVGARGAVGQIAGRLAMERAGRTALRKGGSIVPRLAAENVRSEET